MSREKGKEERGSKKRMEKPERRNLRWRKSDIGLRGKAGSPSGKARLCKSCIRRFDSDPRLQSKLFVQQ
jgi:hypothetical protein